MQSFAIASLNIGLLRLRVLGMTILQVPAFVEKRFAAAPGALRGVDADILALQEVFGIERRKSLAAGLKAPYMHAAFSRSTPAAGQSDGFLVLSRHPIVEQHVHGFARRFVVESLIAGKGFQVVDVDVSGIGLLRVFNVHLTAGGSFHKLESAKAESVRASQIDELLSAARSSPPMHILVGDFNAGPEASRANYQQIRNAGYVDCFSETRGEREFTWESTNPLNARGPYKNSPSQRIDHVFLPCSMVNRLALKRAEILLKEPNIEVGEGRHITLSDHYALRMEFRIPGRRP